MTKKKVSKETETIYVFFKRCNRSSNFIRLPQINQKLQYTSFLSTTKESDLNIGDIINTSKQNQLLIVYKSKQSPEGLFDIEKSSFSLGTVLSKSPVDYLDSVKIASRKIGTGEPYYVINKRKFSFIDIQEASEVLNIEEQLRNLIHLDEDSNLIIPGYFYSLLGSLKADLFESLQEED